MPNFEAYCCCPGCGECSAHRNEPKRKAELAALRKRVERLKSLRAEAVEACVSTLTTCESLRERVAELERVLCDLLDDAALEHETRKYGVYQIGHDSMTDARRLYHSIKRASASAGTTPSGGDGTP